MEQNKYYKAKINVEVLKEEGNAEVRIYHFNDVDTNVQDLLSLSNLESMAKLIAQRGLPDERKINIQIESG